MPNTVVIKGRGIRKERLAGGGITPGHLIEVNSSDQVVVHSTADGTAQSAFAVEAEVIGQDLDHAYLSGETVFYEVCMKGQEVNAILATSQTIAAGDFLSSAGDGTLQAYSAPANLAMASPAYQSIVGVAMEAVTTTGATARIKVEVL